MLSTRVRNPCHVGTSVGGVDCLFPYLTLFGAVMEKWLILECVSYYLTKEGPGFLY